MKGNTRQPLTEQVNYYVSHHYCLIRVFVVDTKNTDFVSFINPTTLLTMTRTWLLRRRLDFSI